MQSLALPLLLCSSLFAQQTALGDLAFHARTLAGWEGEGFTVFKTDNAASRFFVSSQDRLGRKAMLHRIFVVPAGAGVIRFSAAACRPETYAADDNLDVVLLAAGKRVIPKWVRAQSAWTPAASLLPEQDGQSREYLWRINDYVGQHLRIVLIDEDDRPGCHVSCSGFQILPTDEFESRDFSQFMVQLAAQNRLAPIMRYDSRHFLALSNADDAFTEMRLGNCELLYTFFLEHFRGQGFTLHEPPSKLMVAMFDSQSGFNAYLGRKTSPFNIGVYHPPSNRLVIYDYGQNELHQALKNQAERQAKQITSELDRQRSVETVHRRAEDFRAGANITTVMHEVAHQLSFNCGLLNREGDVPFWLAEGLACYCEAADNGSWQGIGAANPQRQRPFATSLTNKKALIGLRDLLSRDDWAFSAGDHQITLLAYAQSWALFRMLMEEQPQKMRSYLKLIYPRQISGRRLADFQQAFGSDVLSLQRRHETYVQALIQQHSQPKR